MSSTETTIKKIVRALLSDVSHPTPEDIRQKVDLALRTVLADQGAVTVDRDHLIRVMEADFNVFVPQATWLVEKGHVEWLPTRRSAIVWRFWNRYAEYLEQERLWVPDAIAKLGQSADDVLRKLADPTRPGAWDRRGMVVGQVQSGKTAHYAGLICKAADAGYKAIIVLAGAHNSLRSQTQLRLDEGFLGFDTQQRMTFDQTNVRIGVGRLAGAGFYHAHSLTSSAEKGDFNLRVAQQAGVIPGSADPVLLVVKKYKSVLENVIRWATNFADFQDTSTGRRVLKSVPLLVIDDEADYASVNTLSKPIDENGHYDDDQDPSVINGLIRSLLHSFEQAAYVGYTATPFANIFIYDQAATKRHGEDLFPRSFIANLRAPTTYMGPVQVFGLDADAEAGTQESEGLPIIRKIDDHQAWLPDRHKNGHSPGPLPPSLVEAIRSFILVCAARMARGQDAVHNSMLVHVTRFTSVQDVVAEQIQKELASIRRRIEFGDGSGSSILDELRTLWEHDQAPTTARMAAWGGTPTDWRAVQGRLVDAVSRIEVRKINGTAKDALDYYDNRTVGLSVIAVGGDKLSRGLTLEGLTVSYYLRASRMYDTLMQMGRWFGYRPGYGDLCRLYTTAELADWYKSITAANEELLRDFDHMAACGGTPADFGLRVKNHPDGLLVTARAKLKHGTPLSVTFSATIIETLAFYRDDAKLRANLAATEDFVRTLDHRYRTRTDEGTVVWDEVKGSDITDFLARYASHARARKAQTNLMTQYIDARLRDAELTSWTVALLSVKDGASASIGGRTVHLVTRNKTADSDDNDYVLKRLVSPRDEALDFSQDEQRQLLAETLGEWELNGGEKDPPKAPSPQIVRKSRPATRGLLLIYPLDPSTIAGTTPVIGWALSFPKSENAKPMSYTVNNVYWQQEFELE